MRRCRKCAARRKKLRNKMRKYFTPTRANRLLLNAKKGKPSNEN